MNTIHYYCDICKKEFKNEELVHIVLELKYRRDFEQCYSSYDLCDLCAEKVGFKKREFVDVNPKERSTTPERLYEIIAQIIYESQQS